MTASTIPSIGIDFGGTSIKMGVVKGAEVIAHALAQLGFLPIDYTGGALNIGAYKYFHLV